MKRIYRKRKSSEIKKKALEQLRETRAHIDDQCPELLDRISTIIQYMNGQEDEKAPPPEDANANESVKIDRQKNLETILRFIELKPHSDDLKQQLKKLLT